MLFTWTILEYEKSGLPVACFLHNSGFYASVVNAALVHGYGNNGLWRAKADKKDAIKLAMKLLGQALALPEWWGRNLDALYDCLTEPVRLELDSRETIEGSPLGPRLLRVLEDAVAENPWLELSTE